MKSVVFSELKSELKTLAAAIREKRPAFREAQRQYSAVTGPRKWWDISGADRKGIQAQADAVWKSRSALDQDRYTYRHLHIAYSLARGRTIEQIEAKVHSGNKRDDKRVEALLSAIQVRLTAEREAAGILPGPTREVTNAVG